MTQPIAKERKGTISVSAFKNTSQKTKKDYTSVNVQTGIRQADGTYKNTSVRIFDNQIPALIDCLTSVQGQLEKPKK